jgi:hypothetical protein
MQPVQDLPAGAQQSVSLSADAMREGQVESSSVQRVVASAELQSDMVIASPGARGFGCRYGLPHAESWSHEQLVGHTLCCLEARSSFSFQMLETNSGEEGSALELE